MQISSVLSMPLDFLFTKSWRTIHSAACCLLGKGTLGSWENTTIAPNTSLTSFRMLLIRSIWTTGLQKHWIFQSRGQYPHQHLKKANPYFPFFVRSHYYKGQSTQSMHLLSSPAILLPKCFSVRSFLSNLLQRWHVHKMEMKFGDTWLRKGPR